MAWFEFGKKKSSEYLFGFLGSRDVLTLYVVLFCQSLLDEGMNRSNQAVIFVQHEDYVSDRAS